MTDIEATVYEDTPLAEYLTHFDVPVYEKDEEKTTQVPEIRASPREDGWRGARKVAAWAMKQVSDTTSAKFYVFLDVISVLGPGRYRIGQ
jgi:hypothetical protein